MTSPDAWVDAAEPVGTEQHRMLRATNILRRALILIKLTDLKIKSIVSSSPDTMPDRNGRLVAPEEYSGCTTSAVGQNASCVVWLQISRASEPQTLPEKAERQKWRGRPNYSFSRLTGQSLFRALSPLWRLPRLMLRCIKVRVKKVSQVAIERDPPQRYHLRVLTEKLPVSISPSRQLASDLC